MNRRSSGFAACLALMLLQAAWAAESGSTVTLTSEAIRLVVNNTADGRGRFAVEVAAGDPERPDDDGQPLIYGRPIPWTSYTVIRLDGRTYAFGGPTVRRAGRGLPTGEEVLPPAVRDGAIITAWRYGDLEVMQHLSIVEGPTTGRLDTARIAYTMINRGSVPHRAGLRIALDTMLGENDGAPFRVGQRQILTDEALAGGVIEPYWQAFDSLEHPQVIAQGTLAGEELSPPDLISFTNWGNIADTGWHPPLVPGRDFTRLGEFELDSAVALIWEESGLPPGGMATRVTYYGLGGVTIARGELTLGLTAPAAVPAEEAHGFLVLGYLENRGRGVAREVVLDLDLPAGLRSASETRVGLGRLKPGETRQVAWTVFSSGGRAGPVRIRLAAGASGLDPIAVERELRLVAPARLEIWPLAPPRLQVVADRFAPYPLPLGARVVNTGGAPLTNAWAEFIPLSGMALAPGEGGYRFLGEIGPGEEARAAWSVVASGPAGPAGYAIIAGSDECRAVRTEAAVIWPVLPRCLRAAVVPFPGRPGWWRLDLTLVNLPEAAKVAVRIDLAGSCRLVSAQRGAFFVEEGGVLPWASPPSETGGWVALTAARRTAHGLAETSLATVWLAGRTPPSRIEAPAILDAAGRPLSANVVVAGEAEPPR